MRTNNSNKITESQRYDGIGNAMVAVFFIVAAFGYGFGKLIEWVIIKNLP